jgi:Bacterial lectin
MRSVWLAPAVAVAVIGGIAPAASAAPPGRTNVVHTAGAMAVVPVATSTLYEDSFAGSDTPAGSWTTVSTSGGGGPCLTAASGSTKGGIPQCPGGPADQPGTGMLQLTDNAKAESGYVISNNPIIAKDGAHISFDMSQYNAKQYNGRGGDGISFFLVDGSIANPAAGKNGGALGYNGLQGAILGLGFDEYGNFSTTIGGAGGPGLRPNSVVVRGAASTSYTYISGTTPKQQLAVDAAKTRTAAARHVTIDISHDMLTVSVAFGKGTAPVRVAGPLDLTSIKGQPSLPATFKYGFAASTGSSAAYHAITDLIVSGLPPKLALKLTHQGSSFQAGGTGTYQLAVSDDPSAGPTISPVTVSLPVPAGYAVTSAGGDGWQCATASGSVTCTRPGTGGDTLQPGGSYPPVMVAVSVPPGPAGSVTVTGSAKTNPGPADGVNSTDTAPVTASQAAPAPPSLSMMVTPQGDMTAGGTAGYKLTVSNAPSAGPTTGTVTATFPVPAGQTVTAAGGTGWTCSVSGQTVTCTRPGNGNDALLPGGSYPPVTIATKIPPSVGGTSVPVTANANTPGNADPNGADGKVTVPIAPAPVVAPSLSMTVTPQGDFTPGGTGSYQLQVSDAPDAGPTTSTITATFPVPAGQTITSAGGTGWTCSVSGQTVTCTNAGAGKDALAGGASELPIDVNVMIPATATGQVPVTATANTPGNADPNGAVGKATVQIGNPPAQPGPDLSMAVTPQGDFTAGGTGGYQLTVGNAPGAGPTTGTVTATFPVPAGQTVTSATGIGWTCSTAGQQVSCTRPGSGDDALQPGSSYPPVTITTSIPASAAGPVPATATANTPGNTDPNGAEGKTTVTIAPAPVVAPSLSMTVAPQGNFTAGGTGAYQLQVSTAPGAGPTTGPVTATFPVTAGQTITSANGMGWTCTTAGQTVTCTRSDVLQPGSAEPPVTVAVQIPPTAAGTVPVTATAGTPGNADPNGGEGKATVTIGQPQTGPQPAGPALSLTVMPQGNFVAGGAGSYQLTVSNAPDAGPTTGTVTETFTVPDGQTVTSATGDGWTCSTAGQKVTCTRPGSGADALKPGSSYPPVTIATTIAPTVSGQVDVTVGVNTPGNANPDGAQGTATVIVAPQPSAGSVVCRGGNLETTIGPGITFQTKTVQMTGEGDVGQCSSPSDPTITGGTFNFQATGQGECPNGLHTNGTGTIIWNNGQTSTIAGTAVVSQDNIGEARIHVTKGEFAGDTGAFTGPITYLPWYQCVFPTGIQYARGIINEGFLNP